MKKRVSIFKTKLEPILKRLRPVERGSKSKVEDRSGEAEPAELRRDQLVQW